MTNSVFYVVFVLVWRNFISRTSGAVVNIDLVGFQGGILKVPENQRDGEIKVQLSEAVQSVEATVVCNSLKTGPGLTAVQFTPSSASVGTTQVNVAFRIVSPGRPITIQCSAQSQRNSTQFTLSGSKGNNGSLEVVAAPVVRICPDVVLLHKYQLKSSVQVQFSERIQQFVVDVRCSTVQPDPGGPPALQIKFTETRVAVDEITAQVPYEIVSLGVPVQVICRAQPTNLTGPIVPPKPSVSTPAAVSVSTPSSVFPAITATNLPSSATLGVAVTTVASSISPAISGSLVKPVASLEVGGRKKRSVSSSGRTVLQYQFNTSAGAPVTFALDLSPLRILPQVAFIRAPNGSFSAVLALDQPADNTVDVRCSLDAVSPGDELYNTTDLCFGEITDKVTFANNSVEIKLSRKEIQFQKDELFKNIDLTLTGSPVWRAVKLVRVTCCGQDTGLSLRYVNETAVAFAWVEVRKLQPVDWSGITSEQRRTTLVSDIDLTCPCNLKENSCDVGCCCDQDCSDFENKSSTCIPGFFGGATFEKPFEFSCQASWPDARDWQPFLCIAINNSPLIGFFYNVTTPSVAADSASFNTLAGNKKRQTFTFLESEERQTTISGGLQLYTAGTTIKTAVRAEDVNYATATVGVLSLPRTVFNGLCSQTAPVRYLEDVSSQCVLELEDSLCNSQSSWNALNYLMPIKLSRPACSLPAAVLAQGRLNDTVGGTPELASTEIHYYCGDVSSYVFMTTRDSRASVSHNSSSLFERDAPKSVTTPERCAFDDGETLPPSPVFNTTTRVCSNVVVKVEYEIKWSERRIDAVMARVTLGSVQIPALTPKSGLVTSSGAVSTISQNFSIKFIHSAQLNSSSNVSRTPFERSGNPGYLRGRPVLSRDLGRSSGQVTAGKIQLWSPGPNSLCSGSSLTPVLYGMDAFSGCLLRLSLDDLRNCTFLREVVLTNQNRLIQATHVGRSGNADLDVPDDWLPIIREPISNNSNFSSEDGTCPSIPSGMVIEMLVTDAGKYAGVPQLEIVGTRIRFQFSTWRFNCVSGYGVSCSTSNVSDTGRLQAVPSPQDTSIAMGPSVSQDIANSSTTPAEATAGSSVTPTANVQITPTASSLVTPTASSSVSPDNGTGTRQYQPRFEYFMVTSSVVFIKVPAVEPQRVKRTADQSGICYRGVCKEELFFPLTEAYQGEPREKTLALSLFLIFLALITFAVTKPWG